MYICLAIVIAIGIYGIVTEICDYLKFKAEMENKKK